MGGTKTQNGYVCMHRSTQQEDNSDTHREDSPVAGGGGHREFVLGCMFDGKAYGSTAAQLKKWGRGG